MTFADKITLVRILLIPFFVSCLFYFNAQNLFLRYVLIAIFALAVITDFFDGLVARLKKEKSDLGVVLDPLADKLLLLTSFISLYALRGSLPLKFQIPLGVVLVVVSRDVIILLGFGVARFLQKKVPIAPTIWGKFTTSLQMFTILCVLLDLAIVPAVWSLAVIFTVISGIGYLRIGVKAVSGKDNNIIS